jgi:hypothetical protein
MWARTGPATAQFHGYDCISDSLLENIKIVKRCAAEDCGFPVPEEQSKAATTA